MHPSSVGVAPFKDSKAYAGSQTRRPFVVAQGLPFSVQFFVGERRVLRERAKSFLLNETEKEQLLRRLQEALQANPAVVFAFVHGSFLEEGPFHDIDIAVLADDALEDPLDALLELWEELAPRTEYPLDLQLLNEASLAFRYNVTRGRLIFARDEERALQFIERTWDLFFDFQPVMERYIEELAHA